MLLESGQPLPPLPADRCIHQENHQKEKILRYINVFLSGLKKLLMVVIFRERKAIDVVGNEQSGGRKFLLFCVCFSMLFKFCYLWIYYCFLKKHVNRGFCIMGLWASLNFFKLNIT